MPKLEIADHRGRVSELMSHHEQEVRECLGRWVSECEPCLIFKGLRFKGLGIAGRIDGKAKAIIKVRKTRPTGRFNVSNASMIDDDDD